MKIMLLSLTVLLSSTLWADSAICKRAQYVRNWKYTWAMPFVGNIEKITFDTTLNKVEFLRSRSHGTKKASASYRFKKARRNRDGHVGELLFSKLRLGMAVLPEGMIQGEPEKFLITSLYDTRTGLEFPFLCSKNLLGEFN